MDGGPPVVVGKHEALDVVPQSDVAEGNDHEKGLPWPEEADKEDQVDQVGMLRSDIDFSSRI